MSSAIRRFFNRLLKQKPNSPLFQLRMTRVFQSTDVIAAPRLETNFSFEYFSPGLEKKWVGLLNESGEFGTWTENRFEKIIMPGLFPKGCVFILDGLKLIACSATCLRKETAPLATLMYVLVLPQYRGRNLSFSMNSEVLRVCQEQGLPGVTLLTDDFRLPAIRSYLNLGFVPDMEASLDARQRWEMVFFQLNAYKKSEIRAGL